MSAAAETVNAQLVMLDGDMLLLPSVAVADVVRMTEMESVDDGPNWVVGRCVWRGVPLPVVSFEGMCDRAVPTVTRRQRLVIVHGVGPKGRPREFALLSQAHPCMVALSPPALQSVPLGHEENEAMLLARVSVAGLTAGIPDIEAIVSRLPAAPLPGRSG